MVWLRAEQSGCLSVPNTHVGGLSWGETKRKAPKLFAAFGARSLEWVLLEAVDVTTTSLVRAGGCPGSWWLSGAALESRCCHPRASLPGGMRCPRQPGLFAGLWYLIVTLFNC